MSFETKLLSSPAVQSLPSSMRPISHNLELNAAVFLCSPDCVAEREGFYAALILKAKVLAGYKFTMRLVKNIAEKVPASAQLKQRMKMFSARLTSCAASSAQPHEGAPGKKALAQACAVYSPKSP